MNIYDKIKALADKKGLSIYRIEKDCHLSMGSIMKWAKSSPKIENIHKVANYLDVDINYLLGKADTPSKSETIATNLTPLAGNEMFTFKVIGTITAGYGGGTDYNATGEEIVIPRHLLKSHNPDDYFVLEVRGDSMFPLYLDGDKVLIRKCDSVDSGKIAAIGYDGEEATLKKVEYIKGENWMKLIPRNPEYPTKTIRNGDLELCRIYGEVVYLFRDNIGF